MADFITGGRRPNKPSRRKVLFVCFICANCPGRLGGRQGRLHDGPDGLGLLDDALRASMSSCVETAEERAAWLAVLPEADPVRTTVRQVCGEPPFAPSPAFSLRCSVTKTCWGVILAHAKC